MACAKIKPKDREEWLYQRSFGIGSSEVGTILGVNRFETPLQLWRRKVGIDPPKEENFAMTAGHYLEDAVSRFYADKTNATIIKSSAGDWLMVDCDKPYLRVSPDRTFWHDGETHNEQNKCILECKTTRMEIDKDYLPQSWFCQLQYQMHVSGYRRGALAWLRFGSEFDFVNIDYDPEFCSWMIEQIDKFWHENIMAKKEPEPINAADILLKNPRHIVGKTINATAELVEAIQNLKQIKEDIKASEQEAKELEEKLKMAMNDAEAIVAGDKPLVTWKAAKDGTRFNAKALQKDHPDIYKNYSETKPGARMFLVK